MKQQLVNNVRREAETGTHPNIKSIITKLLDTHYTNYKYNSVKYYESNWINKETKNELQIKLTKSKKLKK